MSRNYDVEGLSRQLNTANNPVDPIVFTEE